MSDNILKKDLTGFHIHFVGIKGTGMAALVEIVHSRGAVITGSDVPEHFYTDEILSKLHIVPYTTFDEKNITDDTKLVIYSAAYKKETNPELAAAEKKHIPLMLYSEALGAISETSFSCGICGVHGKTTTTGICGTVLNELELPFQALAGSVIGSFGDTCTITRGHKYFVAETCEYQRHFMAFCPQIIILTSVESDHEDYYPTFKDIQNAFVDYALKLPKDTGKLIYCADDSGAAETVGIIKQQRPDITIIPYGDSAQGDFQITFGNVKDEKQYFTLKGFDVEFYTRMPGKHIVRNCTAAIALAVELLKQEKLPVSADNIEKIRKGISSFCGAKRRSEIVGKVGDVLVMDDYAHHPTAIKTTLQGLKAFYPSRRLVVDFMSHTYTRTAALFDDFAHAFDAADEVILHKIYPSAREKYDGTVTGRALYEKTKEYHSNVHYFEEVMDAEDYVRSSLKDGDLFITMGAGDNWKLGKAFIEKGKKL